VLLEFAEQTNDEAARSAALERLRKTLPEQEQATAYESWVRGRAHRLEQNWTAAIEDWQRAVASDPFQGKYRLDLADALEHEGRLDEAIALINESVKQSQQDKGLAERLSRLYHLQKAAAIEQRQPGQPSGNDAAPVQETDPSPANPENTDEHAERI
jgi:tetratricopeptide (TPR) repeat protein